MNFKFIKLFIGLILLCLSVEIVRNGYSLFWIVLSFYGGMIYNSAVSK